VLEQTRSSGSQAALWPRTVAAIAPLAPGCSRPRRQERTGGYSNSANVARGGWGLVGGRARAERHDEAERALGKFGARARRRRDRGCARAGRNGGLRSPPAAFGLLRGASMTGTGGRRRFGGCREATMGGGGGGSGGGGGGRRPRTLTGGHGS